MSVISKIFGTSKKGDAVQSPSEAVQHLREVEEMLQKKSDFLEQKIEHEVAVAKKNSSKNKQGLKSVSFFLLKDHGNSAHKLRHPISVAYWVELVLLNRRQIWGAALVCTILLFCTDLL